MGYTVVAIISTSEVQWVQFIWGTGEQAPPEQIALHQPQLGLGDSLVTGHCWTPEGFPLPCYRCVDPGAAQRRWPAARSTTLVQHTRGSARILAWRWGQCKLGPGWDISLCKEHTWHGPKELQVGNKEPRGALLQGTIKCLASPPWGLQPREEFESRLRQGAEAGFKARWRKADSFLRFQREP